MVISLGYITGVMLGFEFYTDEYDDTYFILDLLIARIIVCKVNHDTDE